MCPQHWWLRLLYCVLLTLHRRFGLCGTFVGVYGYVWVFTGMCGVWWCVWVCVGVYGFVWACTGMFGSVRMCVDMCGCVWSCVVMWRYVYKGVGPRHSIPTHPIPTHNNTPHHYIHNTYPLPHIHTPTVWAVYMRMWSVCMCGNGVCMWCCGCVYIRGMGCVYKGY